MKNILILTFYYQPDLCAGSFRATNFVKSLQEKLHDGTSIDIITTMPNRYHSFKNEAPTFERYDNVSIKRIKLPDHKSGMVDQSKAFAVYAIEVAKHIKGKNYDLIFATSSRLFTAFLGAIVSKLKKAPLYLDIRDIFTDTLDDVLATRLKILVLPILRKIEKYTIRSACKINLVSEGFKKYFFNAAPDKEYTFFPNGIDEEFLNFDFQKEESSQKKVILYAGNIGAGQGLEKIIPESARFLEKECEFWIIGDGGTRPLLEKRIKLEGVDNVRIFDPVSRDELLKYYSKADLLFLHLNDYEAFKKVLPSKIFEFAATGKPILAGVSGYSKEFIETQIEGAAVFQPCNVEDFISKFESLDSRPIHRDKFIFKYTRKNIMDKMALEFIECGKLNE